MNIARSLIVVAAAMVFLMPDPVSAQDAKQVSHYSVFATGCYVREANNQEWSLRLVGKIPSLCGAYMVVHDAAGKTIYHGVIPHGSYPEDKPYVVTIKPDGIAGDYKIVIVGHQNDMLGLTAPFTDLPFEVYGGWTFAIGDDPNTKPFFKAPEGVTKMKLGAYKGHLKVFDKAGKIIADTRVGGQQMKYDNTVEFAVTQGETYQLHREECFYFKSYLPGTFFIVFQPERWFSPSTNLDTIKWWEGVK